MDVSSHSFESNGPLKLIFSWLLLVAQASSQSTGSLRSSGRSVPWRALCLRALSAKATTRSSSLYYSYGSGSSGGRRLRCLELVFSCQRQLRRCDVRPVFLWFSGPACFRRSSSASVRRERPWSARRETAFHRFLDLKACSRPISAWNCSRNQRPDRCRSSGLSWQKRSASPARCLRPGSN